LKTASARFGVAPKANRTSMRLSATVASASRLNFQAACRLDGAMVVGECRWQALSLVQLQG
jgi:hypothetical protein